MDIVRVRGAVNTIINLEFLITKIVMISYLKLMLKNPRVFCNTDNI